MRKFQFKKGFIPWNKNHKGYSTKRIGQVHTEETKRKISKSRTGKATSDKNGNWKGGVTDENRKQRTLFQNTIQKDVFERDNYTCQLCGSNKDLQVDHIQSWSEYIELRFNINNCRTLCSLCHYKITYGKPMPKNIKGWGHNLLTKGGEYSR